MKNEQNNRKAKSQVKLIVEIGPEKLKKEQNHRKAKSNSKLVEGKGLQYLQEKQKNRKNLSRIKQMKESPDKVKDDQRRWQSNC